MTNVKSDENLARRASQPLEAACERVPAMAAATDFSVPAG
jgi:hypothetical protein